MAATKSELQVITFAKKLCGYVMTITLKSPKQFRFSLIGRLQGYSLDVVENLYEANDIYAAPSDAAAFARREAYQRKAMSRLKLLSWMAQLSMECGAIQPKQFEQISKQTLDVQNLLGAWIQSDRKRQQAGKH